VPARTDKAADPTVVAGLLLARRGTAFFSRKLAELSDADFDAPSLLPGWSRRMVVAHVGYNARALTRLVEWAATSVETPMYTSAEQRLAEIEYGATLTPVALRHLHHHAAVSLSVEWRDLPFDRWPAHVRTIQGRVVPVSETIWLRTREVWLHAIDLDNGATMDDFPVNLLDALLSDVEAAWARRGVDTVRLVPTDRPIVNVHRELGPAGREVRGTTANLVRWATGRSSRAGDLDGTSGPHSWGTPPTWF